jgi:hypothetical protein
MIFRRCQQIAHLPAAFMIDEPAGYLAPEAEPEAA